jgi:nitrate reductase gamma subunit
MGYILINVYIVAAVLIGTGMLVAKGTRLFWAMIRYKVLPIRNRLALDEPAHYSWGETYRRVLLKPVRDHNIKTRGIWTVGFILYHVAIITLVAGYSLSALILAVRIFSGEPVPDIRTGLPTGASFSPANILAIIFGNAEPVQAKFLFGRFADLFVTATWVDVCFALAGNGLLWVSVVKTSLRQKMSPAEERAPAVWPDVNKYIIRTMISMIILSEVLGRLDLVPGMVYLHSALGVTLLALFCFTYLAHILYTPLLFLCAVVRCQKRSFA